MIHSMCAEIKPSTVNGCDTAPYALNLTANSTVKHIGIGSISLTTSTFAPFMAAISKTAPLALQARIALPSPTLNLKSQILFLLSSVKIQWNNRLQRM